MSIFFVTAIILGCCLSILSLGIFLGIKIFNIPDITTDGSYTFGAVITGVLMLQNISLFIILPLSILGGAIAGCFTGFIHTKFKVQPLLAGILVMTGFYSINLAIMGKSNLPLLNVSHFFNTQIIKIGNDTFSELFNQLLICLLIVGLIIFLLNYFLKTDMGLALRATGNNESMANAVGINTNSKKILGLAIGNGCIALSGFLVAQYQGFIDVNMGIGIVITGLGSVLIANTFIKWFGVHNLLLQLCCVVFGSIVFQLVLAITLTLGVDTIYLKLITALIVLSIVAFSNSKNQQAL